MKPRQTSIRQDDTHRLIPTRYSDESVMQRLTGDDKDMRALFDLESATSDRLLGEMNLLPGISIHELLFGVPFAHIVNAAFTYGPPGGYRFNGPERGAWYAAFELRTAEAEVAYHKARELSEIAWPDAETFTFHDYLADFRSEFDDIRKNAVFEACLSTTSYQASQQLGRELLAAGSAGIVYPSVRKAKGTCIVCFRPVLVTNVRQGNTITMTFSPDSSIPEIS